MIRWFKRWRHRRDIIRRLVAYAKTPEGRTFIEAINEGNLIMADWEAEVLGAEPLAYDPHLRIALPVKYWRILNAGNSK